MSTGGAKVQLALYDLSRGMASQMSQQLLGTRIDGIWHTGIVVFGMEYFFGGGIQVAPFGNFSSSQNLPPVSITDMGTTTKSRSELESYLRSINHRFTQATYDLLRNNCNNFSDTVCQYLCGHGIPSYIVDLPRTVMSTPMGSMLMPMIENMQNGIRQQTGNGLDPFANVGQSSSASSSSPAAAANPFHTLQQNLFQSPVAGNYPTVRATAVQPRSSSSSSSSSATTTTTTTSSTSSSYSSSTTPLASVATAAGIVPAKLEENPLVSTDGNAATVEAIANKILKLAGPETTDESKRITLSEDEARLITLCRETIVDSTNGDFSGKIYPSEVFHVFLRLVEEYPSVHMSTLFLLRLVLLSNTLSSEAFGPLVDELMKRLATGETTAFGSIPSMVMALCSLANLLSTAVGKEYLLGSDERFNALIDVAMTGLRQERVEVRQMSSTLAYNFTLQFTSNGKDSGWSRAATGSGSEDKLSAQADSDELAPAAVQILCGVLEGLNDETDSLVRKRRLSSALRILRTCGRVSVDLANDLGFQQVLEAMIRPSLDRDERELLLDITASIRKV